MRQEFLISADSPNASEEQLNALHKTIFECTICRDKNKFTITKTKSDFSRGDVGAKIMFIGESPGDSAIKNNKAFAGNSFNRIKKWFSFSGYTGNEKELRDKIYFTSVLKCKIEPNNRPSINRCFGNCSSYLWQQISIIQPSHILILGKPALEIITGNKFNNYSEMIGEYYTTDQLFSNELFPSVSVLANWYVFPHPSGLNRLNNDVIIQGKIKNKMDIITKNL